MGIYMKKPVLIEAIEWTGSNIKEMSSFMNIEEVNLLQNGELNIPTLEGIMHASIGDYIIKGIEGEFYPCKPDIFWKTYDQVDKTL